jgi:hypothetical protein
MERSQEPTPDAVPNSEIGFVDRVRSDLDRADAEGDETRLETLEKIRGDLEAELDSSLENRTTGH